MADQETFPCQICGEQKKKNELVAGALIRPSIVDVIEKDHPAWSPEGYICHDDLNRFRTDYVRDAMDKEKDEFTSLEKTVSQAGMGGDHLPKNDYTEYEQELTLGEHLADTIAGFAGRLVISRSVCRHPVPVGCPEQLYFTRPAL